MNINIDQMDHAFDVLSGFESICNKDFKTVNAKYAQTVLKMNGCDLGAIAGQEGFGTAIKEGAKKVIEMIWNLIKGIKDFFFGSKGRAKEIQMQAVNKEAKEVAIKIKHMPDLEEKVQQNSSRIEPSVNKIAKAATKEIIELKFAPYVNFMAEYFDSVADAKIEGYSMAAQTGKATLGLDVRADHLKLLNAFRVLETSFIHLHKNKQTEEIEAFAVIESVETGNSIIASIEKFRGVSKEVLQNVNGSLERSTVYYEKIVKDTNERVNAEAVLKFTQSLSKAATKMVKLVDECDNFIIQVGGAICKINKEVTGDGGKLETIIPTITSNQDLDKFMNT